MIQVGISSTKIEPSLTHGHVDGIGVYTAALMQTLPACGCNVQGFAYTPPGHAAIAGQFTHSKAMPHSFIGATLRDALPLVQAVDTGSDIFHFTDYQIVRMRCPVVATVHDAVPLMHPEWASPRLRTLKNIVQKRAIAKADHVIAQSQYAVAELVQYFDIDPDHISVVPAGVSAAWMEPSAEAAVAATVARHGLRPGYFLFVGTLQPRKNVDRILSAYLDLPETLRRERQLVIVGRRGWHCDALVKRILAAVEHGEPVVWLQNVEDETALRHIYTAAGALIFPSLYEGFGIPVAEAFACGLPVVTSNTTSLPEVSMGAALEIDPLDTGGIAEAMRLIVSDEGLRSRCIAAGRQQAIVLAWPSAARCMAAVYRRILGIDDSDTGEFKSE